MATIYRADIHPTKLELIGDWLSAQPWYAGPKGARPQALGAYRFDDPAGEVGIETHLVRVDDGPVLQVPLTYRGAPLPDGEPSLIGTMEHSVLGQRWVYDACADPVYVTALATTIVGGGGQAVEYVELDGGREARAATAVVQGSGSSIPAEVTVRSAGDVRTETRGATTICHAGGVELVVHRVVGASPDTTTDRVLTGTWEGQETPALLAELRESDS